MNAMILLCFLVLLKCAYAQIGLLKIQEPEWRIINSFFETDKIVNGNYRFGFVSTDGIRREESGGFDDNQNYVVTGYYSYYDEHGTLHHVKYTADKNGYNVIPLPPKQSGPPMFTAAGFSSPRIVASFLG
ncbi:unnamed protein product [Chilo suppressalis]|uniref:Uncharacterized protein n=1 Tax=Chilo suppressalis TaxID=168631 RepID=A0ABN8LD64_CHISP|nr:unnamed protein product [Chilo suppressalis]